MMRFSILLVLGLMVSYPVHAQDGGTGLFETRDFVATTEIVGPDGTPLSLCYAVSDLRLFGVTLNSHVDGYVLAPQGCAADTAIPLDAEAVRAGQAAGLIDADIDPVARDGLMRHLRNYGLWAAIIMGLVAVIIRRVKALMGLDLGRPLRKKGTRGILRAMCHVAHCDGVVDARDIRLIRKTAQRLTRRQVSAGEVIKIANSVAESLNDQDYIDIGRGLRDREKDLMMQGAFYVALSTGRLIPSEYNFLVRLAYGIGMPGEDFRRVMNQALTDLDTYPPT